MFKTVGTAAIIAVTLSGCVNHQWAYGPTATMPFNQTSGQCQLTAIGAQQPSFAFGSASFVAGAAVGGAIGGAVRANQIYNACLEAQGFVPVDQPAR